MFLSLSIFFFLHWNEQHFKCLGISNRVVVYFPLTFNISTLDSPSSSGAQNKKRMHRFWLFDDLLSFPVISSLWFPVQLTVCLSFPTLICVDSSFLIYYVIGITGVIHKLLVESSVHIKEYHDMCPWVAGGSRVPRNRRLAYIGSSIRIKGWSQCKQTLRFLLFIFDVLFSNVVSIFLPPSNSFGTCSPRCVMWWWP